MISVVALQFVFVLMLTQTGMMTVINDDDDDDDYDDDDDDDDDDNRGCLISYECEVACLTSVKCIVSATVKSLNFFFPGLQME